MVKPVTAMPVPTEFRASYTAFKILWAPPTRR